MQNSSFPANWLYELKQRNNIVSVIEKYIRLEKRGGRYWACCPFHNEKTPSFTVNGDEGFYHCFGCKESGDVISFIMKYESCDFLDAIEILAKNANMQIPEYKAEKEVVEKKQKKDRLLKLLDTAQKHYQENLYLPEAKSAQDYLKQRKFTKQDLDNFRLGCSLNAFEIVNYLKKQGFTQQEMIDAGIVRERDGKVFDISARRLVFPIFNSFNECVGFSSRVLDNSLPKYINTPETMIFHKGRVVFGINLVKELKQKGLLDSIIIVEGQIDVIAMHRAGFKSAVACMGTALTTENARELKKLADKVVLCFDGDGAGIKATIKSIDILKDEGFDVKIVSIPDKHDPDEIIKEKGAAYLSNLIDNALPIADYLIKNELKKYNLKDLDQRGKFVKASLEVIAKIETESQEEPYLEKIRQMTAVPIDVLRRDLNKIKNKKEDNPNLSKEKVLITRENGNIKAIKYVLGSIIHKKEFVNKNIDYKKLLPRYKEIIEKAEEGIQITSYWEFFDVDNSPMLKESFDINFEQYKENGEKYFEECLRVIASQALQEKQKEIKEQLHNCEDNEERKRLKIKLQEIMKAISEKNLEEFYVGK